MAKRPSFRSIMGKRLSDITNSHATKPLIEDKKPPGNFQMNKDHVDKLIKEKMTLMKLIAERNKIIELSGAELQKMRVSLQKLQLQNWHLAQSNSQMLAELNSGREKLKALQHQIICKGVLLKAKNLGLEENVEMNDENTSLQEKVEKQGEEKEIGQSSDTANEDSNGSNRNRRRTTRSRSMGSTTCQTIVDKEKVESKRRCLRRQSARFKSHERENPESLFELEDAKFSVNEPLDDTPMHQSGPSMLNLASKNDDKENSTLRVEVPVTQRSSMARPLRKAAEKVQSYKEVPLKVKLRRKD